ncbi:MAG: hypothetical protein V1916_02605 [Patescibacteria group bacterium]
MPERPIPMHDFAHQKPPDEQEAQFRLASLKQSYDSDGRQHLAEPDPALFSVSPHELRERLAADPQLQAQYEQYLENLRQLRREDRAGSDVIGRQPAPLVERILRSMQGGASFDEKLFRDEELDEARRDPEKFTGLLRTVFDRRPAAALQHISRLRGFFTPEEVKSTIYGAAEREPGESLLWVHQFADAFDDTALNAFIEKSFRSDQRNNAVFLFDHADLVQRLRPDLARGILHAVQGKSFVGGITTCIELGLSTPEEARGVLFKLIRDPELYITDRAVVGTYLGFVKSPEDRAQLQAVIAEQLEDTDYLNRFFILDFEMYGAVLGEEWKQSTVEWAALVDPLALLTSPDVAAAYLPPDLFDALALKVFADPTTKLNWWTHAGLLEDEHFAESHRKLLRQRILAEEPSYAILYPDRVLADIPPAEQPSFIRRLLIERPDRLDANLSIIDRLTDFNEEQKVQFARDLLLRSDSMAFLDAARSPLQSEAARLHRIIPPEQMKEFIFQKLELNPGDTFMRLNELRQVLGSDAEVERVVRQFASRNPREVLARFNYCAYLFPMEERVAMVRDLASQHGEAAASTLRWWADSIPRDVARELVLMLGAKYPDALLGRVDEAVAYLAPGEEREQFVRSLVLENPMVAVGMERYLTPVAPAMTRGAIIAAARSDSGRLAYAPKTIADYLKRLETARTIEQRDFVSVEGMVVYQAIHEIRSQGFGEQFLSLQSPGPLTSRQERQLLDDAYCFALANRIAGTRVAEVFPNSPEQLKAELTERVCAFLDARELDADQRERAIESFGGTTPLLLYGVQHAGNSAVMDLLKEVFRQSGRGEYRRWRFGLDQPMENMTEAGLIPAGITAEQLQAWSTDEESDSATSLESSSADVARAIQTILRTNAPDLGSEALLAADPAQATAELKRSIKGIGAQLEVLGKSLKDAPVADRPARQAEITELKRVRDRLLAERDILRLCTLTPEELSQGYLLEGEQQRRSQRIHLFVKGLQSRYPETNNVFGQIERALSQLGGGEQVVQTLVAQDTADLRTSFHIGATPVASCQHYASGGLNEALLGYVAEANTKITTVSNEKRNIIGRRVTRLLSGSDGTPALFLENKYSSSASGAIDQLLLQHVMAKAGRLGVRVYMKNAEGTVTLPGGYRMVPSTEVLSSGGGRAPFVYVDAARGEKSYGMYSIAGIVEIVKQTTE